MADAVISCQAEEGERFQKGNAKRAFFNQCAGKQAGLYHGGQYQGVNPDTESRHQSPQGPFTIVVFPEDAAQHGRGKLGDGGKGNQADGDQAIDLTHEMKVGITEHQH